MGIILPCYKNINEQNLDKKENIIYVNNIKSTQKNTIDLELINQINDNVKIENIEKKEKKIEDLKKKEKNQPRTKKTAKERKKKTKKKKKKIKEKKKKIKKK